MAFSYDDTLSTSRDKVRHSIRDTIQNEGILPGGVNFSDDEIDFELTLVSSWEYVVPRLLRIAANAWSSRAAMLEEGSSHMEDTRSIAKHLRLSAEEWDREVLGKKDAGDLISYNETEPTLPFYETGVTN